MEEDQRPVDLSGLHERGMEGGREMTKQEFENALRRSVEAMLDGGQPGIDDILLIGKALGGVDFEMMDKYERDTYLFGVQAGYMLGIGKSWQAPNESKTKERCNCKRLSDSVNESQTKALENQTKAVGYQTKAVENQTKEMCEWCEGNVSKYFDVNWYDFTEGNTGARPKAKFCPNCGQAIDWSEE